MARQLTFGIDAEYFLFHPVLNIVPATSHNTPYTNTERGQISLTASDLRRIREAVPRKVDLAGGSWHRDNVSVEIQSPVMESFTLVHAVMSVLRHRLARSHYQQFQCDLRPHSIVAFDDPEKLSVAEAHEMGCKPDIQAFTQKEMEPPSSADLGIYRTGSAHIHVGGIEDYNNDQKDVLVQWLDILAGWYVLLSERNLVNTALPQAEQEVSRRRFYGQPGRYRRTSYGIEWRFPSADMFRELWITPRLEAIEASIRQAVGLTDAGLTPGDFKVDMAKFYAESIGSGLSVSALWPYYDSYRRALSSNCNTKEFSAVNATLLSENSKVFRRAFNNDMLLGGRNP